MRPQVEGNKAKPKKAKLIEPAHAMNVASVCGMISGIDYRLGLAVSELTDTINRVNKVGVINEKDEIVSKEDWQLICNISEIIGEELELINNCRKVAAATLKNIALNEKAIREACPEL